MSATTGTHQVDARLEQWRRGLIDLSHRNRLIAFKPTRATTLRIAAPSLAELLAEGTRELPWDFYFPPELEAERDSDDASQTATTVDAFALSTSRAPRRRQREIEVTEPNPKRIARVLDNLAKRSATEFSDKAIRILYVAAGFLDWRDAQREKDITSPLVLVPVELRRHSTRHPYQLHFVTDEDIVINPSLTEKLRRDAGLEVPADWAWEDKPIGDELEEIRRAVASMGWSVRDEAVIGLFSFQKYVMFRDLLDNAERVRAHSIVRSLAHNRLVDELAEHTVDVPGPADLDDVQPPEQTLSILDADASQRVCIEAAKRGQSFVMQGPPGTGKSQTIANVIAEAIGQGKRVLFVSEKAAALDVVHKRLAASGLDEYCLMLHGERAGRREVVQALDHSLHTALEARHGLRAEERERLANLRVLLNQTAEVLHERQPLLGGRSLREVHEQLAALHAAASVPGAPEASPVRGRDVLDEHERLAEVFQRLSERWHVSPLAFAWRDYAAERFGADDRGRVLAVLRTLASAQEGLRERAAQGAAALALPAVTTRAGAEHLTALLQHLDAAPTLEAHWLDADPRSLRALALAAADGYRARAGARERFGEAFPARALGDLDPGAADRLATARDLLRRSSGWTDGWQLAPEGLPALTSALGALPELIGAVREQARTCARRLGQSERAPNHARIEQLAALAELTFTADQRPEPTWLVRAGHDRARTLLDEVTDDLDGYQQRRATLLERWQTGLLDLDTDALRQRFSERYTSFFARLSGDYRNDARALKALRPDAKLPKDGLLEDLAVATEARELRARLTTAAPRMQTAFGGREAGLDTDAAAIRSALKVSARALELSDSDADLGALAAVLATGSAPDPSLAQAATQLRDAAKQLDGALAAVQPYVAQPATLFGSGLDELGATVERISPPLTALLAVAADLEDGAERPARTFDELGERAATADAAHAAHEIVTEHEDAWRTAAGGRYAAEATPWQEIADAAAWLAELRARVDGPLPAPVMDGLLEARAWPDASALDDRVRALQTAGEALCALFDPGRAAELAATLAEGTFDAVGELTDRLEAAVDDLYDWTEFKTWRARADAGGWSAFAAALVSAGVKDADVVAAFQAAYWHRRLEAFFAQDPDLADDLRGGAFGRWVNEFRELDLRLVATGAERLIARREALRTSHVSTPGSEIDLLKREARKKARHLPVRKLLERIPTLLSELKPCLMMSPLTVSHFLSPAHRFDLVVFDEASQVPPQDAVNCIYRGQQLVVAGDSKQLPPTQFFQVAELDELSPEEEDAGTSEDMESILDSCEALLEPHPLRWHYRSRAEGLIAFSNRHIYRDLLVTFPSALDASPRYGVGFTHVPDGVYDRGRTASDRREAQVVARRVVEHLTDGSGRSLGVIAFNSSQASAITEELDLLRAQHPELEPLFAGDRLDGVFVKHLEAVQGDERDVIVFSVGYGRGEDGAFSMNFGPLNKDGGQRRLNVAVTRAREYVEVVASVRAADFRISDGASIGARLLRDYVAYAEAGGVLVSEDEPADPAEAGWPSALEEQVGRVVAELGFQPVPQVGAGTFRIDVGVRAPDDPRFLLGIECDGPGYARTPTARDRERLRHEVLAGLGWGPIHRIWSLDWVRNRAGEVERLRHALQDAHARREALDAEVPVPAAPVVEPEPPRERRERVVHELAGSAAAAQLPWTRVYERARLGTPTRYYEFHETVNRREQTDMLIELLKIEAPISIDLAIRRVAEAWGLSRVGHRVVAAGRQSVSQAVRRGAGELRGEFIWRPEQTLTHVRIPDPDAAETRREIDEIPPEEIDLALTHLRDQSPGIDAEQQIVQGARVLGFDRVGGRIRAVLEERVRRQGQR